MSVWTWDEQEESWRPPKTKLGLRVLKAETFGPQLGLITEWWLLKSGVLAPLQEFQTLRAAKHAAEVLEAGG
jgi:hypothetical protein